MRFLLVAAGAAATFWALRRREARERLVGAVRERSGAVGGTLKGAAGPAQGALRKVTSTVIPSRGGDRNDPTIEQAVETHIFRHPDAPKGSVVVNVEYGVVVLRGEVPDAAWKARLVSEAREVAGVKDVRDLMHLPGEPAPAADPHGGDWVREHADETRS